MENIFFLTFGLIIFPIATVLSLKSSLFSLTFIGISLALLTILYVVLRGYSYLNKRYHFNKNLIIYTFAIGQMLLWSTLLLSYRKFPETSDVQNPIAQGGFPLTAFLYPFPPMGNDEPPREMWLNFFIDYFIWFIVGFVLALVFHDKLQKKMKNLYIPIIASIYLVLYGIGYIGFKFD